MPTEFYSVAWQQFENGGRKTQLVWEKSMGNRGEKLPSDCVELFAELDDFEDLRDAYARVQNHIRSYSAAGRPVPEALLRCERHLMTEFMSQSQGR